VSRGLTFWNDETIRLIRENFIAVSVPTWVARAPGPEGDFLRQAGINKRWVTSSGYMHCVSASGKFLGGRPCTAVLEKFNELPAAERKPGALIFEQLNNAEQLIPAPPEGGLVLRVHARFLARADDGQLRHAQTTDFPLMLAKANVLRSWNLFLQPNTEYMWLTRNEWLAMVPANPAKGQKLKVNPAIAMRMARFHLTPQRATTSEGGIIHPKRVKEARLRLKVESVTPQIIHMKLEGRVHWGSDFESDKATTPNGPLAQGYATPIDGRLEYDLKKRAFTRFDIVALGDTWGRWGDANGRSMYVERPGRSPFGFAFELASGDTPTDRIPPGGNGRYVTDRGYFRK
jgi:hypothetical protein